MTPQRADTQEETTFKHEGIASCPDCNRPYDGQPIALCGWNRFFAPETVGGCGLPIWHVRDLYRCSDCAVGFHKQCLIKHFTKSVTQDDVDREERT